MTQQHPQEPGPPSQGRPHTLFLEQMGAAEPAPRSSPSTGSGRRSRYRQPSSEKGKGGGEGRPTSPNPSNSKPRLPSEVIRQQLYLFHLSNYHIIKCMNYKRAKALKYLMLVNLKMITVLMCSQ